MTGAAYLEQACGNDAALRQEVDSLLKAHEAEGSLPGRFVDRCAKTEVNERKREEAGTTIGRYKLLEPVGDVV